jgi:dTDP-4-dehydrorhamnose reductase
MSNLQQRTFLFGASSILGWSFMRLVPGIEGFCNRHTRTPPGMAWRRLNLQEADAVRTLFRHEQPDVVFHCAGVCDVDKCEAAPEFADLVNVQGMQILLDHLPEKTRLVYLSSDHVFSGDTGPYTEASSPDPISVYGRTRVRAEEILLARRPDALIVRAGLWIGPSHNGRIGHLDWLRYRHARGLPMTIVSDEYRSAVWADDAVARICALVQARTTGIRHVVASRVVSRPALASYLDQRFAIGAHFAVRRRSELQRPHIGRMDLRTDFHEHLAAPLPPVVPEVTSVNDHMMP